MTGNQSYEQLERSLTKGLALPGLPEEVHSLAVLLSDPDTNTQKLREIISADPESADAVLQAASSACYGTTRPIRSIEQAMLYLGSNTVYTTVVAARLNSVIRAHAKARQFDRARYSAQRHVAAVAASYLYNHACETTGSQAWPSNTLFACASLENMVLGLMAVTDPTVYDRCIIAAARFSKFPRKAFEHLYGGSYCALAGNVAEAMNLEPEFVAAQRYIDAPLEAPEKHRVALATLHLSSYLLAKEGMGLLPLNAEIEVEDAAWEIVGVDKLSRYEMSVKVLSVAEEESKNRSLRRAA